MDNVYCYSDSGALRNKLGIHDKAKLCKAEIRLTAVRLYQLYEKSIQGDFDFNHICHIHYHIFQDLYPWAGKIRTVDIAKGDLFCRSQFISSYADTIFPDYYDDCQKVRHDKNKFVNTLTKYYADLNALHPFREGNGRSQREFARELCAKCGYALDLRHTDHQEMLSASIASFDKGDNTKLESIFRKCIKPLSSDL